MSDQSLALFLQACGAAVPLRLGVEPPAGRESLCQEFREPSLLIGRGAEADLRLDDPAVSKRHAYLQVIGGRLFCLDLASRTGVNWDGLPRRCGWLEPGQAVGIGPFAVRLLSAAGPTLSSADWDPLAALPPEQDALPPVSLEILNGPGKDVPWRMDRTLALVGEGAGGGLRLAGRSVARPSCGLLRTPLGLWVINLLEPQGVCVNGTRVRWARLEDGDVVLAAGLWVRVRYPAEPAPAPPPTLVGEEATDVLTPSLPGEAERAERELLLAERNVLVVEAEQLRSRLRALEQSLVEAAAERDELARAGQEAASRWEGERLALREQWEQQARAQEEESAGAEERERFDQERQQLRAEADRLRQEAEELKQNVEQLTAELARAGAGTDEAVEQLLALQAELEASRAELADARQQRQQRDAAHEQLEQERWQLRDEAERLRQEAVTLRQDGERLTAELARATAISTEAAERLRALQQELEGRGEQEAALREELEAARAELADSRQQWQQELERARQQFDQERRELRGEADRLRQEAEVLRQDGEQLAARLGALQEELEARQRQEAALREELEAARAELADARGRWQQQREADRQQFDQERQQWRSEAETLRQQAEALKQDGERLTAELARAAAGTDESAEQLRALQAEQLRALQAERDASRAELAEAHRQWQQQRDADRQQLDQERQQLRGEVERLRQDGERLTAELARATARSDEAAVQMRALQAEVEGRRRLEAGLRQALESARVELEARRQWQQQVEAALRAQREREAQLRQSNAMSVFTVTAGPTAAPAQAARRDEPASLDALFTALGKASSTGSDSANRPGERPPPQAGS